MRFRFEEQEHQKDGVRAVVDALERGAVHAGSGLELDDELLLTGIREVQARNGLATDESLGILQARAFDGSEVRFPNLSIEMETGTGKTYTYIRTALTLGPAIGANRFVIVVPSVAIREGVAKTFEVTRDYFAAHEDFAELAYDWAVYRSDLPHVIEDFVRPSTEARFLITTLASFNRSDTNLIFRQPETMQLWSTDRSASPMERLQRLRVILILDEPQNMGSALSRQALATLHPLVALRYTATHTDSYNMVYRLGPVEARRRQLVKRVAVRGVQPGLDPNVAAVRLEEATVGRRRGVASATVTTVAVTHSGDVREQRLVVRPGDDLAERTGRDVYSGYIVDEIRRGAIRFQNGQERAVREVADESRAALWRDQLYHTIRLHVERQAELAQAGLDAKVLSLVFVQHVSDYDGPEAPLPALFDAEYRRVLVDRGEETPPDPSRTRIAYFARTARGDSKDTAGLAAHEELEVRAFDLIMRDKERLLSFDEPAAFVFSHSALAEGWDNPNVFQICFLRHVRSPVERRQQVGRGLRLPVTQQGERVRDDTLNRLTLVVDESYEEFVAALNFEYAAASDGLGGSPSDPPEIDNDALAVRIAAKPEKLESEEFARLWRRIHFRTRYRLEIDSDALVAAFAADPEWDELRALGQTRNTVVEAELTPQESGFTAGPERALRAVGGVLPRASLPDLVALLEANLHDADPRLTLTRRTLGRLLAAVRVPETAIWSPEQWAAAVARRIRNVAAAQLVDGIRYELLPETDWWEAQLVLRSAYSAYRATTASGTRGVLDTQVSTSPSLYTHVDYDSKPELKFAQWLEANELIRLYVRLPRTFEVSTPVGTFSPDFAIVADHPERGEVVYLVQEVKDSLAELDRRDAENLKIRYARKHFSMAPDPVEFEVTTGELGMRTQT